MLHCVLDGEECVRLRFNDFSTDMSGWTREIVLEVIISLVREGEIEVLKTEPTRNKRHTISLTDFVRLCSPNPIPEADFFSLSLGFTDLGGRAFEQNFKPDWNRYFSNRFRETVCDDVDGREEVRGKVLIVAGSPGLCYEMLGAFPDFMEWDKKFGLRELRTGVKKQWQATYWKVLEHGYFARATFRYDDATPPSKMLPYLSELFVPLENSVKIP